MQRLSRLMGNRGTHRLLTTGIQAKLTVNQPGDEYEREADRVADAVMRMPDPASHDVHGPRVQRRCAECEEEPLQRKADRPGDASGREVSVGDALSGGRPLPASARNYFEPRFDADFSAVRIHSGPSADRSAEQIDALAYTTGHHIVFRDGQYDAGSPRGRRLLAHELTHVIQQTSTAVPAVQRRAPPRIQRLGDVSKRPAALDLRCPLPPGPPNPITAVVEFGNRVTTLSPLDKAMLAGVVRDWHAAGATQAVRVDGFASQRDTDELNWELSCGRAEAVVTALTSPSGGGPGITRSAIVMFAHGETAEFGDEAHNRRATLTVTGGGGPAPEPTPTPGPAPTPTPTPTPGPSAPVTPSCAVQPGCPADFCRPFATRAEAIALRDSARMSATLIAVAGLIDPAVHSLWDTYLHGGSSEITLGPRFQFEFGRSIITALTTDFLVSAAASVLRTTPGLVPPGAASATFDLATLIPSALRAIDTPGGSEEMDFNIPLTVEGNIAGAIGKDQTSCLVGATPSPRNDERLATGTIELTQLFGRTYFLTPHIEFTVIDTIDLCPGGCGAPAEHIATIPLSRLEASGVSGDVPIRVTFPASLNRRVIDVP